MLIYCPTCISSGLLCSCHRCPARCWIFELYELSDMYNDRIFAIFAPTWRHEYSSASKLPTLAILSNLHPLRGNVMIDLVSTTFVSIHKTPVTEFVLQWGISLCPPSAPKPLIVAQKVSGRQRWRGYPFPAQAPICFFPPNMAFCPKTSLS